ncbi:LytTR family DNA-binding domain-containing protein [Algoriphagus sp. NG3]|uniref:LytR/AlgR family response regulator transcription factor n=1 Tax=unclassified Algoriphagus TaxID=2641541 RepID=UPI002A83EF40|nr:LytTR family DNA-binding domain-containing protein [Algoriphagus sp. NG3]WPR76554.1 LytTR family DNA-binding domain-containing protein [Algoriphagus sp. NG3]
MITCIIIDDEQHAIDLLKLHINQVPFLGLKGTFLNPVAALEFLHEEQVDLIFLDVQLPGMSGIEFLETIQNRNKVILTTAYNSYAIEGFDHAVVDYLLKPIAFPRFMRAAQRALALFKPASEQAEDDFIMVKTESKGKLLKINFNDILYVEGLKNYVGFHTIDGTRVIALLNLKDLEIRLPTSNFARIHKSFIVSIKAIEQIDGNLVWLKGSINSIPIGVSYREDFIATLEKKMLTNRKSID